MDKIRVNLMLGEKQLTALKKRASAEDTSVSRIIRTLIDEYLKKGKR
jgi:predicted DNA binding CopG/RHH family protein